ncbi:MAG TPA: NAD-dependent epimerase/dehydratase family protein [Solirubrobacteraceae bacterium]|nr:NAD-dependent epimerase/dehydratase family protein [Solirubrobacteraceae bacterium]
MGRLSAQLPAGAAASAVAGAFETAAAAVAAELAPLRGAAIHVNGASGFLAANLLALLDRASALGGLELDLHASARRPPEQVALFRFLGVRPHVRWELAGAECTSLPERPGCIAVHTASYGAPRDYLREPVATFQANTLGLMRTFEEAARVGAAHVVYLSSAEVYGQPPDGAIPTREDFAGAPVLEDPRSIYAESKRMAEVLGLALSRQTEIPFTAVRPWNLYGPGQRLDDARAPLAFLCMAMQEQSIALTSDGTPTRSPCFVWDGLLQLAACLGPAGAAGGPVNIGNPQAETSIRALAELCAAQAGLPAGSVSCARDRADQGLARCVPDISRVRARARTAPAALTALEDGVALLHEWVCWARADARERPQQ